MDETGNRACVPSFVGGDIPHSTPHMAESPEKQMEGTITDQNALPYGEDEIGWWGSYKCSGCTYIAIYNGMQLIGQPQSIDSIVNEVYPKAAVLFGAWGAGPWGFEKYMEAHGVPCFGSASPSALTANISDGDVILFTMMNSKTDLSRGWHSIAVVHYGGYYFAFNDDPYQTKYTTHTSLEEVYSDGIFLYGVRIQ